MGENELKSKKKKKHSVLKRLFIVVVVIGALLGGMYYISLNNPSTEQNSVKDLIQENGKNEVTFESYDLKNIQKEIAYIFEMQLDENPQSESSKYFEPLRQHIQHDFDTADRFFISNNWLWPLDSWSKSLDSATITLKNDVSDTTISVEKRENQQADTGEGIWSEEAVKEFYSIGINDSKENQVIMLTPFETDIKKIVAIFADEINFSLDGKEYNFVKTKPNYKDFDLEERYKNVIYKDVAESYVKNDTDKELDAIIDRIAKEYSNNTSYFTAANDQNFGAGGIYPNGIYEYNCINDEANGEISVVAVHFKTDNDAKAIIASVPSGEYNAKTGTRVFDVDGTYAVFLTKNNVYIKTYIGSKYKDKLNDFVKDNFDIEI